MEMGLETIVLYLESVTIRSVLTGYKQRNVVFFRGRKVSFPPHLPRN